MKQLQMKLTALDKRASACKQLLMLTASTIPNGSQCSKHHQEINYAKMDGFEVSRYTE